MAEVVHSLTSSNGRLRIDVVRRPTGGYQLAYFRYIEERVPEYDFVYEGWMPISERVTLMDTPERGAVLAAEAMKLFESQDAE